MRYSGYIATVVLAFCLAKVACQEPLEKEFGVPVIAKVWSVLTYLLQDSESWLLQELFPVVTRLDEAHVVENDEELANVVGDVLVDVYERADLASLLLKYCDLYPMGFPDRSINSLYHNELYFLLNGNQYSSADDVFYFKSGDLTAQAKVPDADIVSRRDIIIGTDSKAPVVILYGCPSIDSGFDDFNRNLYSEATQSGKLRYIWRSTCSLNYTSDMTELPLGFTKKEGVELSSWDWDSPADIPKEFVKDRYQLYTPTSEELNDIDMGVASLISSHYKKSNSFKSTLKYAKGIVNNFLLLVPDLLKLDISDDVFKSNEKLTAMGIDYNMLGVYINGQNIRYSVLNEYNLLNSLFNEFKNFNILTKLLKGISSKSKISSSKKLLSIFSQVSLPNLRELQPVKLDLHRHVAFSNSVIYFNDIEKDPQYKGFSKEVDKFFEKSKYGELPEYKKNWNEVIFVIDFNNLNNKVTQEALAGLLRALTITLQGYPQRIGLLPLHSGSDKNIIRSIYELKDTGLAELKSFLEQLSLNENNEINDKEFLESDYDNIPGIAEYLNELEIYDNSLIINGEIYVFKPNTWHYLITKIIKKDVALLKRELRKYSGQKDVDVRGILHLKSSNIRHSKYTPDYFSDATFTSMNNTVLRSIDDNIIEYIPKKGYNLLHTVTIVDGFTTLDSLKRLDNLINIGFAGVRVRIINRSSKKSVIWSKLQKIFSKSNILEDMSAMTKKKYKNVKPSNVLSMKFLSEWLPDITDEQLKVGSFIVLNGRFIHLDEGEIPSTALFEAMIQREAKRTLDSLNAIEKLYPHFTEKKVNPNKIEMLSALLSKIFYHGTQIYNNGLDYKTESTLPRMDLSSFFEGSDILKFQSSIAIKPIDMLLIIDPLEERSQKILTLVSRYLDVPFINFQVVLLPTKDLNVMPIQRVYNDDAEFDGFLSESFSNYFDIEVDCNPKLTFNELSNVKSIILEVNAFNETNPISEGNVDGIGGVCLEVIDESGKLLGQGITMGTFGYAQFSLDQLSPELKIQSCDSRYKVSSFSVNGRPDYLASDTFSVIDFNPLQIYVKLQKTDVTSERVPLSNITLNVLTTLKGSRGEEEDYKNMLLSILSKASVDQSVKFWLVDGSYTSSSFREFCKNFNENPKINGEIKFLKYEWPTWLRPQRFLSRKMDIFKLLFIDVMMPMDVGKVLYMDASRIEFNPFKVIEGLESVDMPFIMLPMGGDGYWNEGYWEKMQKENGLKFFSTKPTFVINVNKLREIHGGDELRIHYQRLSADLKSLVNIDQDLVNDMQLKLPIAAMKRSLLARFPEDADKILRFKKQLNMLPQSEDGNVADGQDILHDEL